MVHQLVSFLSVPTVAILGTYLSRDDDGHFRITFHWGGKQQLEMIIREAGLAVVSETDRASIARLLARIKSGVEEIADGE